MLNGRLRRTRSKAPTRPELGYGADLHEYPRTAAASRQQKDAFYRPGGAIADTCDGKPCVTRGLSPDGWRQPGAGKISTGRCLVGTKTLAELGFIEFRGSDER
jgi:hypothetical protein